jgi:hypothetical protein
VQLPPGSDHNHLFKEVMMAGDTPSISRRRILGAAAALPFAALAAETSRAIPATGAAPDAALWNTRLAVYRRLFARARAAAETGWFRAANDLYYRQCDEIAARFGGDAAAARSAEARALRKAGFRRVSRAEDLYWRRCTAPMQEAAAAPDLAAVRAKIAVLRAHDLDEHEVLPRPALELVDEDLRRLSG